MNCGMTILNESISMMQNYVTCILTALSFILNDVRYQDGYKDMADDVKKFISNHISNHEVDWPLSTGKNKKVIGLMKDKCWGKVMREFVALGPKCYSYLMMVIMIKKLKEQKNV